MERGLNYVINEMQIIISSRMYGVDVTKYLDESYLIDALISEKIINGRNVKEINKNCVNLDVIKLCNKIITKILAKNK